MNCVTISQHVAPPPHPHKPPAFPSLLLNEVANSGRHAKMPTQRKQVRRNSKEKLTFGYEQKNGVSLLLKVVKNTIKAHFTSVLPSPAPNIMYLSVSECVGCLRGESDGSLAINGTVISNEGLDLQACALL